MGNDNCCAAARKRDSNFDKSQKNYINMLFTTISENNESTKKKHIIDAHGFSDYMFETDYIQKILTDQLFGKDQFVSYESFCNFCANLIFSDTRYKMYYFESLIEWKVKLVNPKLKGDSWRQTQTSLQQLQQFIKEIFKIIETTDSAKTNFNIPDPNLILTVMFTEGFDEKKTWDEVINFFYRKYPLVDDILKNYYEYKFLRKPMQFGFPVLQIKQTMAFDYNISSAISLSNENLFRKTTIFNRIFSSGELSFNYETFQQQIENFDGGLLILLKFLGKEIPGTHHQQVVGVYVPEGFSPNFNREGGVFGSSEIVLFEISPHFQPIFSVESLQKKEEKSRLAQSERQSEVKQQRYINYTEKGLGFGYDSKTQKHRIWIDRNMFQNSYILSKDDFFEPGFEYFQNHIVDFYQAWGITKEFPRHSQNLIDLAENNYRQFIKYKNYQQIFSTDNDSSSYAHSYKFQNDGLSYSQIRNTNILDSNGGSYINNQQPQQLMRGSVQMDEEEKRKRTRQLLGSVQNRNQNEKRQTVSFQNMQNKEKLDDVYRRYKDISVQNDYNNSEYDRVINKHLSTIQSQNGGDSHILPNQQQSPISQSTYSYTIQQPYSEQMSQSQNYNGSNNILSNSSNIYNQNNNIGVNNNYNNPNNYNNNNNNNNNNGNIYNRRSNRQSRDLDMSQNNVVVNEGNDSFYNNQLFQA